MAFSQLNKYQIIAENLRNRSGLLLDVGARDKILASYLNNPGILYQSSDILSGHDFLWDLEKPSPATDGSYDFIAALDVLEHVENFHQALSELIRMTRKVLFVSLPNMSCLQFRIQFLLKGTLSAKYDLLPLHQGDRHRWLTSYHTSQAVVLSIANKHHCSVEFRDITFGYGRIQRLVAPLPLSAQLKTYTQLFIITPETVQDDRAHP